MKVTFWLLDINYEVKNDVPEIWLWGLDDSGRRVLVIDRNFSAYFYAVVEEGEAPEAVIEQIEAGKAEYPLITRCETVERKFFGKPVKAVKVYCRDPNVILKYGRAFRKIEYVKDCLEDDVRFSMRYLIDNNMVPCGWHATEAVEEASIPNVQVDKVYVAESFPRSVEKTDVPRLRILGFSIVCYSKKGAPNPQRNPVVIISVATNRGEEKQFVTED